jgi:hypothetical protein
MGPMAQTDSSRSGAERRAHPRAPADWTVELALAGGTQRARLRDVSRAGLSFHTESPIPMMTVLALALELPTPEGRRRIRGSGAVVRCQRISPTLDHYEVAVFLHDMAEPDRLALEAHVHGSLASRR